MKTLSIEMHFAVTYSLEGEDRRDHAVDLAEAVRDALKNGLAEPKPYMHLIHHSIEPPFEIVAVDANFHERFK